jgi:hypothetical protein
MIAAAPIALLAFFILGLMRLTAGHGSAISSSRSLIRET